MRKFNLLTAMIMVAFLVLIGCQKDEEQIKSPSMSITIEEIKLHIGREESSEIMTRTTNRTPLNVLPDFSTLKESINQLGHVVYIGYLNKYSLDSILRPEANDGALIAFFKDKNGKIRSELMLYKHKPDVFLNKNYFIIDERSNFTGINILINDKDQIEKIGAYHYGKLSHFKNLNLQFKGRTVYDPTKANVRCDCSSCYVSSFCNIYCGVMALIHDSGNAVSNGWNWMGDFFSNIYYYWADGEWKKGNWKNDTSGDPNNRFFDFSSGSWGGTWGDTSSGGAQTYGNELWRSELIKCRSQQFNWIDNNGEIEQLDFMELCELKDLVGFSDCAYQYLFENRNDVFKLNYFLNSKKINGEVDAKALAAVKDLINNFCISGYTEVDTKLLEVTYCINKSNASIADKKALLDFYTSSELIDPCSGNPIDKDAIFTSLCGKGNINMAGLDEELEGVDYISFKISNFSSCPKLQCVLNEILINKSVSNTIISEFFNCLGGNGFPITSIRLQDFSTDVSLNKDAYAVTSKVTNANGQIDRVIQFNSLTCNNNPDPLDIVESFNHEAIHALIQDKLIKTYNWNGDMTTYQSAFMSMMSAEYPGNPSVTEHQLMLTVYLQDFKDALMAANGGLGLALPTPNNSDIYLGLILNGYPDELPFIASELGYSLADIQKFISNYSIWIKSNKSPSGIFGKCH